MPTLINVGHTLVVQTICFAINQVSVTNRYYKVLTVSSPTTFGDVAHAIDNLNGTWLLPCLYTGANYRGARCRRVDPAGLEPWEVDNTQAANGGSGAVALPKQSTGLITLTGVEIGKHGEGRVYMPFPAASDNAGNGAPTAGYVTNLQAYAGSVLVPQPLTVPVGGPPGATLQPVVWDRVNRVARALTDYRVSLDWATQKRRGAYGRLNLPPF